MSSRQRLLIALLLPLLGLRALLPAGYMPLAEAGDLRIVMCSAGLLPPAADGGHNADGGQDDQLPGAGGDCPFALSAFKAPPPHHAQLLRAPDAVLHINALIVDDRPTPSGPPRAAAARAPPILS